jgi:hypothetical protein
MKSELKSLVDDYIENPPASAEENRRRKQEIRRAVNGVDDERALVFIVEEHLWLDLPVDVSNTVFEKYVELESNDPAVLREYAYHLKTHGPDWDQKAEELLERAEDIERTGADGYSEQP